MRNVITIVISNLLHDGGMDSSATIGVICDSIDIFIFVDRFFISFLLLGCLTSVNIGKVITVSFMTTHTFKLIRQSSIDRRSCCFPNMNMSVDGTGGRVMMAVLGGDRHDLVRR